MRENAYPSYIPTDAPWLVSIPSHWSTLSARRVFAQKRDPACATDEQLTASQKYGVVPQKLYMELQDQKVVLALKGIENFKHVEKDDFVISLRSFEGGIERSKYSGCVSPAYTVLRPTRLVIASYFAYLLKTDSYVSALQSVTDGIRDGKNISYDQFGMIKLPCPPLPEQTAIAAFLDRETAKIDALVEEQKRLIELLKEKRRAIISHAITKGLNAHAKMKHSGVEWLGDVPDHWSVTPLKYMASFQSGGTPSKANEDYWNGTVPWASAKDLKLDRLFTTTELITETAIADRAASLVEAGSVIVLVRGMMLARAFPVSVAAVPIAINQDLKALNGIGIENDFLAWLLRGLEAETLSRLDEAGHGTKALRMDAWTSMQIPVPPVEEQRWISEFVQKEVSRIDGLIQDVDRSIALLQERRAATICAAVTGKIDVREMPNSALERARDRDAVRSAVALAIITRFSHRQNFGRVKLQKFLYLTETYAEVPEMAGGYEREAAGPLDRVMLSEIEGRLQQIGAVSVEQSEGRGGQVIYKLVRRENQDAGALPAVLGDRKRKFDYLLNELGDLDTKPVEAVTTLFAVWNDFLIDGQTPTDDAIVCGVLKDWHPEKRDKFTADELRTWLGWMRRHEIVPHGHGPRTSTGRLFV